MMGAGSESASPTPKKNEEKVLVRAPTQSKVRVKKSAYIKQAEIRTKEPRRTKERRQEGT